MESISERIKIIRKENNLNQTEFGNLLGVTRSVIKNIELDSLKNGIPESIIKLIALKFNVNEEWLLYGTEPMVNNESTVSFEEYAKQKGMTEIEKEIVINYLELDVETRAKVINMLKKTFLKYSEKVPMEEESKKQIESRLPLVGRNGKILVEETEESRQALKKDFEREYKYNPEHF